MPQIIAIFPRGDFSGCSRNLDNTDPLSKNWSLGFQQSYVAIVDCPVGPNWLFSYGVNQANILIPPPHTCPFPAIGSIWNPKGAFELAITEVICTSQQIDRGPYKSTYRVGGQEVSGCCYDCTFQFQTLQAELLRNEPELQQAVGAESADPIEWLPIVELDAREIQFPIQRAQFLGYAAVTNSSTLIEQCTTSANCVGFHLPDLENVLNFAIKMDIGECHPVQNTAGQRFDPIPERTRRNRVVRVTKFKPMFPTPGHQLININKLFCFEGTVNSEPVILSFPHYNLSVNIPRYMGKLTAINVKPNSKIFRNQNGFIQIRAYWEIVYEVEMNPFTWIQRYLNVGDKQVNPDYNPIEPQAAPLWIPITGHTKQNNRNVPFFLEEPVLLDENGFPIFDNARAKTTYMYYLEDGLMDFNSSDLGLVEGGP